MSDYDKEVLTASSLLSRLWHIEANATNIKHNFVGHTRALDTKVKQLEDRARTQRDESSNIEVDLGHIEADVNDLGDLWCDSNTSINNRLDHIESEIEVMSQIVTKNTLALDEIEERIAIMQEKIDGID